MLLLPSTPGSVNDIFLADWKPAAPTGAGAVNQSSSSLFANSLAEANPANGLSLEANQSARSCSGATSGDGEGENLERSAAMAEADENPENFGGGISGFVGIDEAVWNPAVFVNTDLDFGLPLLSLDLAVDSMYASSIHHEREFMTYY